MKCQKLEAEILIKKARLEAVITTREGMLAANQERLASEEALAYPEDKFIEMVGVIKGIADDLERLVAYGCSGEEGEVLDFPVHAVGRC